MSCCRGRRKINPSSQNPECKTLEDGGAGTKIQVLSTAQGPRLVIATKKTGFLELSSFLGSYKCTGATAQLLRRYLSTIEKALRLDPSVFSVHRSGISVTNLIRSAEQVVKRSTDVQLKGKVPSVPPL